MCGEDLDNFEIDGIAARYVWFLNKVKYIVLVFWAVGLTVSVIFAPRIMTSTNNSFPAPVGSDAAIANLEFVKQFPGQANNTQLILLASSNNNKSIMHVEFEVFSMEMNRTVYESGLVERIDGYFIAAAQGLPDLIYNSFKTDDNTTSIIVFDIRLFYQSNEAIAFATVLKSNMTRLAGKHLNGTNVEIFLTGIPAFIPVIQESVEKDMGLMDGIVLPLALLVLAFILKSFRIMILPLLAIASSAAISFALVWFVSLFVEIISFTPSLMMSILIAMSIDYSLFLLTRYREELINGNRGPIGVKIMLQTAGHTILVSGITLAGCFAGLMLMPIELMFSTGIGCAISILTILTVNITQTPTLLLIFPKFFEGSVDPLSMCGCMCTYGAIINEETDEETFLIDRKESELEKMHKSCWYKLGKLTLKFPFNVIIILVVCGLVVPFALHSYNYTQTAELQNFFPRNSDVARAFNIMDEKFGPGRLQPFKLLFVPPENMTLLSNEFFDATYQLFNDLATINQTNLSNFQGITMGGGNKIDPALYVYCKNPSNEASLCKALRFAYNNFVNENGTATYALISLDWEPTSPYGQDWVRSVRKIIERHSNQTGIAIYLGGQPSDTWAAIDYAFDNFPVVLGLTSGVVFLLVALAFKSVIVPLRSVLTIGLTVAWVFGLATFTYQYGIFDWTPIPGLHSLGAVIWIVPLVNFSIIVGISLDYDVFLLVRVKEYRDLGYSTHDAILQGLYKTGGIITAAGIIMAVAFSGLVLSNMPAINGLGFYLVFAVLFDTFIVRSLLVPALMGILGEMNWFPGFITNVKYENIENGFEAGIQ